MKKSEEYQIRRPLDAIYASEMAAALPKDPVRPKSTVQAASTQRVLEMSDDELIKYRGREMPGNWKANPDAKTYDEIVGARMFDAKQAAIIEDIRHKGRNSLGDFMSSGLSSMTPERYDKAIHAFTYSPPAELTPNEIEKVKKLNALETVDQKIEKKKSMMTIAKEKLVSLFSGKRTSVQRNSIGHVLYKASGGKDEDLDIHD